MKIWMRSRWLLLWVLVLPWAAHAQDYSRTEVITYHDDLDQWVIGQVATVICTTAIPVSGGCNGNDVISKTEYDANAMPWKTYAFGKLQQTLTYDTASAVTTGQRGTLKTVTDGNNNVITLTSWKRGIPQQIQHPATPDHPVVYQKAGVNDRGEIDWITDENGYKTCYTHDTMGRLASITYPSEAQVGICDTSTWARTTLSFQGGYPGALGLPAGHWRQVVQTGNGRKTILFDALWRPVVEQTLDLGNIDNTRSEIAKRYDSSGRLAFQSYPMRTVGNFADPALKGVKTEYDALDRVTAVREDSELGVLSTTTVYTPNRLKTEVTNPNGKTSHTWYMAYDQPHYDWPIQTYHPESKVTVIAREALGKPMAITQRNLANTISSTRDYAYNIHHELCRTVDPETGTTAMGYDGAGNLLWSAAGLPAVTPTTQCATGSETNVVARKVNRTYDARNRLKTLSFADGKGNQVWTYTPDSLPATVSAANPNVVNPTKNSYLYNRRRLLTRETLQPLGSSTAWSVGYAYNANGHRSLMQYPTGLGVSLAPNVLGQQTAAGTFATGAAYAPNGAIASFYYGNNIQHLLTQNARGLPDRSLDIYGSTHYLDDGYDYDKNGNVLAISDGRNATHRRDVDMQYDGLDRLTQATSKMFGNTGALATVGYGYDALDNLTRVNAPATANAPARNHYYCYDDANWRLTFLRSGPVCTGTASPAVHALFYDVQGNVTGKDNIAYGFDQGNRLRTSPGMWYAYDGWGRRVLSCTSSACGYSFYSKEGPLLFTWDERNSKKTEYIYLGGSLVAEQSAPLAGGTAVVQYQHTDALGSPVAVTDQARNVVAAETAEYDPYGRLANRVPTNGPGYTGHVTDAATGLSYMQQRYYDPTIGRFLSIDPVTAYGGDTRYFNRYWYAAGNPYKYTDPDGRVLDTIADIGFIAYSGYKLATEPSWTNAAALGADIVGAAVPFATGLGAGVRAAAHGADAVRGADAATDVGKGADFIVSSNGTVIHSSPDGVRASLDGAGFKGEGIANKAGTETGTSHNIPEMKMDVRVMDGGPNHGPRVVTNQQGTTSMVDSASGKPFKNAVPKHERIDKSHIRFTDQ